VGQVIPGAQELLRVLREEHGLDLAALTPTQTGESGAAFWVTDRGDVVRLLKLLPGAAGAGVSYLRELDVTLSRLRDRGYPAPVFRETGQLGGHSFWIQERVTGTALDNGAPLPDAALIARLLPELLRLNDAQAGLGTGDRPAWPRLIAATLAEGGDGYCVHATLADRADTRELLDVVRRIGATCAAAIPAGRDFVHYDFNLANLLSDGTTITGVVDISPPVLAGDRAFDLATLLFYLYDVDEARLRLWARLLELTDRDAARAYLAHLVLRQVDWSLRFHPAAAATSRHVRLARRVLTDIG
jgi:Ser/Thr protein kinase RdoA (MazF antagonist)